MVTKETSSCSTPLKTNITIRINNWKEKKGEGKRKEKKKKKLGGVGRETITALQICNNQLMARERNAIASVTKFSVSIHRPNKPLLSMQIFQTQAYTAVFTHHCTAYTTCFLHK